MHELLEQTQNKPQLNWVISFALKHLKTIENFQIAYIQLRQNYAEPGNLAFWM